jgi:fructose-1,6-bisphosphatase/sedoheptulose 1,7-bisphosphatase-like protein
MATSDFQTFKQIFTDATSKAAVSAAQKIKELHREFSDPDTSDYKQSLRSDDLKALGRILDGAAVETMQEVFETQSHFSIEIKGSEGRKDTRRDGIESPDLYGSYGPANGIRVEIVNDAVEGTKFASSNTPGATSVLAAALDQKNGLSATGNFDYMSKLFGPPQLKNKLSLDLSPAENFKIALRELNINNPGDLSIVILDRPRNQYIIDSAKSLGVNIILITGGDLTPSLLAVQDPSILKTLKNSRIPNTSKGILVYGSGGWEEGVISAAAAKALGGHAQGKIYSEDQEVVEQAKILEIDDLIPAQPSSLLVSMTPITQDPWFGVSAVEENKAETICITHHGMEILSS